MDALLNNVTLQINLSAGDINYAHITIPALVNLHRDITSRLLIVDCCRPQRTTIVNPDIKYPKAEFEKKVEKAIQIAEMLLKNGFVTDLYFLKPDDKLIPFLSEKYLSGIYKSTHGAGGTANMGYWAGIELPKTRYVLHYDADILLYQSNGYSWVNDALKLMEKRAEVVLSIPRLSPPTSLSLVDVPSLDAGMPYHSFEKFWLNDFFSTRHFLLDKDRLNNFLPLVRGKITLELLIRKYTRRAFPLDPEIILMRSIGPRGGRRLILKSVQAWMLHPEDKSNKFLMLLPKILALINAGNCPPEQEGYQNLDLDAWIKFIDKPATVTDASSY